MDPRAFVHESQRLADERIASAGKPADLIWRQRW